MRSASTSLTRTGLLFLCAVLFGGVAGVAQSAPASASTSDGNQQTGESSPTEAAAEGTAPATDSPAASDETEDEWQFDLASGRRYKVGRIPKVQGTYIWKDENHIRLPGGMSRVEVVKHDDQWFWIKLWEPENLPHRRKPVQKKPTQEELDQIADAYAPEAGDVDRIQLKPFDQGLPRSGQWRQGFDIADMNHDGHLDIVFGPSRKGRSNPNIFLGDSQGKWRRWNEARFPDQPYDYGDAEAADFNGDGHQDIAFGFHLRGMLALVGDGQGGFEIWTEGLDLMRPGTNDTAVFSSRAIEAIDWNQDGRLDLLALGEGPKGAKPTLGQEPGAIVNTARSFALYLNQGDGTWSRQAVEQGSGDFGDNFAIGDFDRDGRPDLAIASRRRGNREILHTSAAAGEDGLLAPQRLDLLRRKASLTSVTAADLDGDGFDELLVGYINREVDTWRTGIDRFFQGPDGEWQRTTVTSEESRAGFWAMAVGELDGDGARDLVAVSGEGQTWVFLGDGQGNLLRETSPELPKRVKGCEGSEVRLVDLDGDGRDEVLASFAGEPTGPAGLPGVISFPGCPGQGRISAWRVAPVAEDSTATASNVGR